jgi:hypothetical protein
MKELGYIFVLVLLKNYTNIYSIFMYPKSNRINFVCFANDKYTDKKERDYFEYYPQYERRTSEKNI